jgi:hypothetical protein
LAKKNERIPIILQRKNINDLNEINEATALEIGKELGASNVILGSISKLGSNFRFRIQTLETADGKINGMQSLNVKEDDILQDLMEVGALSVKSVPTKPQNENNSNIAKESESNFSRDGEVKVINEIECVLVKAGTFIMGSSPKSKQVQRQVTLTRDYYISKYPITNAQFERSIYCV